MAGNVYTIRINLGGTIIERLMRTEQLLDRIIAKSAKANAQLARTQGAAASAGGGGGAAGGGAVIIPGGSRNRTQVAGSAVPGGGPASYRYIPPGALAGIQRYYGISQRLGGRLSQEQFYGRFNNAFRATQTFRGDFVKNAFSVSGWGRNLSNFAKSIGAVEKAAAGAVPLLTGVSAGLRAWLAYRGAGDIIGFANYTIGSRILNTSSVSEAISTRARLAMAQRGLGVDYENAYRNATQIAAEYGYSRGGIISNINTLSGFEVGGQAIGLETATDLSRIIGKVAQLGARPYDIVALNTQQLLAAEKPNTRDIRELLHAAPILSKYALQEMKQAGISGGDPRDWLKDRGNIIKALYRLDEELQPEGAAVARGRIALAKENAFINIAGFNEFWNNIAATGERLWGTVEQIFAQWAGGDLEAQRTIMFQFVDDLATVGKLFLRVINSLTKFLAWFNREPDNRNTWLPDATEEKQEVAMQVASSLLDTYLASLGHSGEEASKYASEAARESAIDVLLSKYGSRITSSIGTYYGAVPFEESVERMLASHNGPIIAQGNAPEPISGIPYASQFRFNRLYSTFTDTAENIGAALNRFNPLGGPGGDTREIEDLTKGSKSLFINFNAPLVQMPTTIESAEDPEALVERISQRLEGAVIRGIQTSLYYSTDMI